MLTFDKVALSMGAQQLAADFAVSPARRVAVLGPSGAGKSTLLDGIAGFRALQSGRIGWAGQDMTDQPADRRPVSILFQDNNLFAHLSLARNLGLALRPDGRKPDAEAMEKIMQALQRVGLDGLHTRLPGSLSGGQQSRAALARVLLQARPILLLDEPFSALGPALKHDMLDLVTDVADGLHALVLMVTHAPQDARRFAQEAILVADGTAAAPVATGDLFADPPPALRAYLGRDA